MFRWLCLTLVIGCSSAAPVASKPASSAPVSAARGPEFGVCFHHDEEYNAEAAVVLDDLRRAGPLWIRGDFLKVERDAAFAKDMQTKRINVLGLLPWYKKAPEGWESYVREAVNAAPQVPAWEITNEPEMTWWGGPIRSSQYLQMLEQAHAIIKSVNRDALIIGPAIGATAEGIAYLQQLIDGGLLDKIDGVSVHYYVYHRNTDLEGIKRVLAGRKPIWITETGWTTADQAGGEEAQLNYVRDYYDSKTGLLAADPAVRVIFHYELNDDRYPVPAGKDDGWGLTVGPQGKYKRKQAYAQFRSLLAASGPEH